MSNVIVRHLWSISLGLMLISFVTLFFAGKGVRSVYSKANQCINNLREMDAAVHQYALEHELPTNGVVTVEQILPYLKATEVPRCPSGGKYAFGRADQIPSCSVPRHSLDPRLQ